MDTRWAVLNLLSMRVLAQVTRNYNDCTKCEICVLRRENEETRKEQLSIHPWVPRLRLSSRVRQ